MNFLSKSLHENHQVKQIKIASKAQLNPNAAEFVPSALQTAHGNTRNADASRLDPTGAPGKVVLDRSESTVSNNSDDEAHQYWRHQLPDDITPDFKAIGEAELPGPQQLSLAGLSLHDGIGMSRFSASVASGTSGIRQDRSPLATDNLRSSGNLGYSVSSYTEDQSSASFMTLAANSWDKQFINDEQKLTCGMEGHHYNGDSSASFGNSLLGNQAAIEDAAIDRLEFLASQFPGFSADSLADVLYANGCDLSLTVEVLAQHELQGNGNLSSEAMNVPSPGSLDFPTLLRADAHNGLSKYNGDLQKAPNTYRSSSSPFKGASDFASAVKKNASHNSGHWTYERNGSADSSVGPSRSSQLLASSHTGHGKLLYGDKSQSLGAARAAQVWLEPGEAVANVYSELRRGSHDFVRIRDAYFEQASQAYLIGNKALARELSEKGHLYNTQMKAAHLKAGGTSYQQRNLNSSDHLSYNRGQERMIDLRDLHVNEALLVLKHELNMLRSTARTSRQQLQAMIYMGNGHHTKNSQAVLRLPIAVEQFLLEECVPYTQPQPGLLHVVIY